MSLFDASPTPSVDPQEHATPRPDASPGEDPNLQVARSVAGLVAPSAAGAPISRAQAALADGFAEHVVRWAERSGAPPASLGMLRNAARAVSVATSQGHVCIHLPEIAGHAPDTAALREALLSSNVVATPGAAAPLPLILDPDDRLYLYRYFDHERRIARRWTDTPPPALEARDEARIAHRLAELFADNARVLGTEVDWQKIAVAMAVTNRFTIISGGPGTGKTTTVVNLLACLLELDPACRIALVAPTGKAAARMQDALRQRAAHLPQALRDRLPTESFTIHRLLGRSGKGSFGHDASNPVPYDLVVVDEASMLDVALAAKLFDAVPIDARIVLLGDKDQLAAVESGAVFSELSCDAGLGDAQRERLARLCGIERSRISPPPPERGSNALHDHVVWFTHNFRFGVDSALGRVARATRAGDVDEIAHTLRNGGEALAWIEDDAPALAAPAVAAILEGYAAYLLEISGTPMDVERAFDAFERFRVLCATREGPRGVDALNRMLTAAVRPRVESDRPGGGAPTPWHVGRPVMVLRNEYVLRLYNGDVGIALPDAAGRLLVHFREPGGAFRTIAPMRLPEHETAFASSVHKAQGSEFENVALVLPGRPSPVLTRELLYTGLTRARRRVTLVSSADVLAYAASTSNARHSGLLARLGEALR